MEGEPDAKRQRAAFDRLSRDDLERALRHASALAALLAFEANGRYKVDMGPLHAFVDLRVQQHLVAYKELQRQYDEPAVLFGEGGPELRRRMIELRETIKALLYTFCTKE
jgi:hypothetical protein